MKMSYRPEIDGLRALAVTVVVLFHAGTPGFSHGFIGVDIFFVISGFLITSIISQEYFGTGFYYGRFVMRRVRRILPALVVVMLVSVPLAWALMLPDPLENFGQSLIATTFSANNILLWLTSGYWDLSSDFKPFLHTWSLGVEEQYYIIYPFVLLLALSLPIRARYTILSVVAAVSFTLMLGAFETDPNGAFYLLHSRAWQLLIGGMAGLAASHNKLNPNTLLASVGLAMILLALIPLTFPMPIILLLATFGSASFLLWSTASSPLSWIFTRRPIIFTGLISYSLYLWHQPVFAFLRIGLWEHPSQLQFSIGIALSFLLAVFSWKYVELPFRSTQRMKPSALWSFVGVGLVLSLTIGAVFHFTSGLPGRLNYTDNTAIAGASIAYNERVRQLLPQDISNDNSQPVLVIAGNSFGRDFSNILLEAHLNKDLTLIYRDDLSPCSARWTEDDKILIHSTDMIVFASGSYSLPCVEEVKAQSEALGVQVFFGGTKHFGNNLNPLVRLTPEKRADVRLHVLERFRNLNREQAEKIGATYLNIQNVFSDDGGETVRVTNEDGVLLTTDRIHLSKAGAQYLAQRLQVWFPAVLHLAGRLPPDFVEG